mmetsp:Transcript_568/g.2001  ORF Transcript_568/g.2001 Transcript_568/m.2001 type:complete len:274 (+) Transcript_568:595-1416(+)
MEEGIMAGVEQLNWRLNFRKAQQFGSCCLETRLRLRQDQCKAAHQTGLLAAVQELADASVGLELLFWFGAGLTRKQKVHQPLDRLQWADDGVAFHQLSHCINVSAVLCCSTNSFSQYIGAPSTLRDLDGLLRLASTHEDTEEQGNACLAASPECGVVLVEEEVVSLLLHVFPQPTAVNQVVVAVLIQVNVRSGGGTQLLELAHGNGEVTVLGQHLCKAAQDEGLPAIRQEALDEALCQPQLVWICCPLRGHKNAHKPAERSERTHGFICGDEV